MSTETGTTLKTRADHLPVAIGLCLYTVVVLRNAWISDDAYITFRTVQNFVEGHGLTWNVAERVQTFTHPLWMFLLSATYALTPEAYFHVTSMLFCALFSVGAVLLFAARVASSAFNALLGVGVFILSKAFIDYSTSGLENPLTHLLLVLFVLVYVSRPSDRRSLLWLSLLGALLMLNRMDTVLFVLPVLAVAFYHNRSPAALGIILLGFLPFIVWEGFALFYYGSLIPNTAYAKLNNGIAAAALLRRGLFYLLASLKLDPLTPIVIVTGVVTPFLTRQRQHLPLVVGVVLYVLYVLSIGGDFMLGRFLTAPLVVAVVLLSRAPLSNRNALIVLLIVALIGLAPTRSPLTSADDYGISTGHLIDEHGICDERAYYYQTTGLLMLTDNVKVPSNRYVQLGRAARERGDPVVVEKCIGMFGYFAGPDIYVVDTLALADPLLARLEPELDKRWRAGHYPRKIPEGHIETLRSGRNVLADPNLAKYYDKLALVTRGDLWDPQRWVEIVKLNLGAYDQLLDAAQTQSPLNR